MHQWKGSEFQIIFCSFWAVPKVGTICGLQLEKPQNALISLLPEDLLFVWPEGTQQKAKSACPTSLKKKKRLFLTAGLEIKKKGERLNGFSALLTLDIAVITLLRDVCRMTGHSTQFFCFFQKDFIFCPQLSMYFFLYKLGKLWSLKSEASLALLFETFDGLLC